MEPTPPMIRSFRKTVEEITTERNKREHLPTTREDDVVFELIKISEEQPRVSKKLKITEYEMKYFFKHNLSNFIDDVFIAEQVVDEMIEKSVQPSLALAGDDDVVLVRIASDDMAHPVTTKYINKYQFDPQDILTSISALIMSGNYIIESGYLTVSITVMKVPKKK